MMTNELDVLGIDRSVEVVRHKTPDATERHDRVAEAKQIALAVDERFIEKASHRVDLVTRQACQLKGAGHRLLREGVGVLDTCEALLFDGGDQFSIDQDGCSGVVEETSRQTWDDLIVLDVEGPTQAKDHHGSLVSVTNQDRR